MRFSWTACRLNFVVCSMVIATAPASPQNSEPLQQAYELRQHGELKSAVAILDPLVHSTDGNLSELERGVAWNVLGTVYQDLEEVDKARLCYEKSMEVLRPIPSAQGQLASAMDNFGSLYAGLGQFNDSERLRKNARKLYARIGDHAGLARVSSNLAESDLQKNDIAAARRNIQFAIRESGNAIGLDDDDIAGILGVRGQLALLDGNRKVALSFFQDLTSRWSRAHGPKSYQVGIGLLLQTQALRLSGDRASASSDVQQAAAIFADSLGPHSTLYWEALLSQAQLMRDDGRWTEAMALERRAHIGLREIEDSRCGNCTISAQAFR